MDIYSNLFIIAELGNTKYIATVLPSVGEKINKYWNIQAMKY